MATSGAAQGTGPIEPVGARSGTDRVDPRLREAAQGFEALLWEEVLRAAFPDGLSEDAGAGGAAYAGIEVQALAEAVARSGGAGLWHMLIGAGAPGSG